MCFYPKHNSSVHTVAPVGLRGDAQNIIGFKNYMYKLICLAVAAAGCIYVQINTMNRFCFQIAFDRQLMQTSKIVDGNVYTAVFIERRPGQRRGGRQGGSEELGFVTAGGRGETPHKRDDPVSQRLNSRSLGYSAPRQKINTFQKKKKC